ncbi:UNKNOWN [Stylonychia lemnae]|uniref:Uncharacterized protein n=1 Tax=Stylonychia lemnae TaxID=5949 RepID=A0A078AXY0_STYLE|nr:UNKNOWN [Stylonychia lemnae]|eukprot:CDW86936.1 UNKNOWN [Stylonychia lemnae]
MTYFKKPPSFLVQDPIDYFRKITSKQNNRLFALELLLNYTDDKETTFLNDSQLYQTQYKEVISDYFDDFIKSCGGYQCFITGEESTGLLKFDNGNFSFDYPDQAVALRFINLNFSPDSKERKLKLGIQPYSYNYTDDTFSLKRKFQLENYTYIQEYNFIQVIDQSTLNIPTFITVFQMNPQQNDVEIYTIIPKSLWDGISQIGSFFGWVALVSSLIFLINRKLFNRRLSQRLKNKYGSSGNIGDIQDIYAFETILELKQRLRDFDEKFQQFELQTLNTAASFKAKNAVNEITSE